MTDDQVAKLTDLWRAAPTFEQAVKAVLTAHEQWCYDSMASNGKEARDRRERAVQLAIQQEDDMRRHLARTRPKCSAIDYAVCAFRRVPPGYLAAVVPMRKDKGEA